MVTPPPINQNININMRVNMTGQRKATGGYNEMAKAQRKFVSGMLSLMFAGQRLAKHFKDLVGPAEELLGVEELRNMLKIEQTLPLAEEEIDKALDALDAWENSSEAQKRFTRTMIKFGMEASKWLDIVASGALAVWGAFQIGGLLFGAAAPGGGILGPVILAIVGIGAELFILKKLWDENFAGIKDKTKGFVDWFKEHFGWVADLFKITLPAAFKIMKDNFETTATFLFDTFETNIKPIKTALEWIADKGKAAWDWIKDLFTDEEGGFSVGGTIRKIFGFQHGGIVTSPTLAMIGERGPEAVVPLGAGGEGFGGVNMNVYITSTLSPEQIPEIARQLGEEFRNELSGARGVLTGGAGL